MTDQAHAAMPLTEEELAERKVWLSTKGVTPSPSWCGTDHLHRLLATIEAGQERAAQREVVFNHTWNRANKAESERDAAQREAKEWKAEAQKQTGFHIEARQASEHAEAELAAARGKLEVVRGAMDKLPDHICEMAPLFWCQGQYVIDASNWELHWLELRNELISLMDATPPAPEAKEGL